MLLGVVFALFLAEITLRIIFTTDQSWLVKEHQDRIFVLKNSFWKVWHWPNNKVHHTKDCFSVAYTTNKYGMRNAEIQLEKDSSTTRVAFLGDSFVEGYGVNDTEHFPFLLDSALGQNVEVLNFGTSGGFGTVFQTSLYQNFVSHFKPDHVVLFFLNYNDLYDNLEAIQKGLVTESFVLNIPQANQEKVFKEVCNRPQQEAAMPAVNNLFVFSLVQKGIRTLKVMLATNQGSSLEFSRMLANPYLTQEPQEITDAWWVTEQALQKLAALTQATGTTFWVVQLPDPYQIDDQWIASHAKDGTLHNTKPNKRLAEICAQNNIDYLDLLPLAQAYIHENNLKYPYFSYECDRHPTPMGHRWLASTVHKELSHRLGL